MTEFVSAESILRRRVKAELRKRMRGLRQTTPSEACTLRSAKIVESLRSHPAFAGARSVALFWPMEDRHEVDLRDLHEHLRGRNALVFYPSIDPETRVMTFRNVENINDLVVGDFGFAEPVSTAREANDRELDTIVVPALAVDPNGHRIGYGAGYYDRVLPRFAPPAVTLGVAFDFQLIAEVPVLEGDVPVDWVVTDSRTLKC